MANNRARQQIDACRDILVGRLPLLTDQIDLITLTLIYKFLNDCDTAKVAEGGSPIYFKDSLAQYRWANLLDESLSPEGRAGRFTEALAALGDKSKTTHLPTFFQEIFSTTTLRFRDGETLTRLLYQVDELTMGKDGVNNAIEHLLQYMGTQGENGQFHTPAHIIDFVVSCIRPRVGERVLDPACGTGGFLVSALNYLRESDSRFSPGGLGPEPKLRGYDITELMVRMSRINLYLHGLEEPDVHSHDTLGSSAFWDEKFDLILANPPFMTPKGGVTPHRKFNSSARKSEVLFMEYIASHLTTNGRAAVVVPNGVCANIQHAYRLLRRALVEESLVAVASLPAGVFQPYSGVKTSVLFLDKALARRTDSVLFFRVNQDGFELGNRRRPTPRRNDLPAARGVLQTWLGQLGAPLPDGFTAPAEPGHAGDVRRLWTLVPRQKLLEKNDVCLSVERFSGSLPINPASRSIALGKVCKTFSGGTPSRDRPEFWANGDIPWISSKHITEGHSVAASEKITQEGLQESASHVAPAGALLLVTRVCVGKYATTSSPVAINQDITAVVANAPEELHPNFLRCLGPGLAAQVDAGATGTSVRGVPRDYLHNLEIPLPPIEEQRRICAEVENYASMMDGARQILQNWKPGIEPDFAWPRVPLGQVAKFEYGHPAVAGEEGEARYIRITDIDQEGNLRANGAKFIALDEAASRHTCKCGDIYIARVGSTAGKMLYFDDKAPAVFASYLIRCVPDEKRILPRFFWYYAQGRDYASRRDCLITGGAQPQLNAAALRQLEIPCPPLATQQAIVDALDAEAANINAARNIIAHYEKKIEKLLESLWSPRKADS
ncbi:MAG: N-6 DNA methylase [Puniceicoccales bacterium]|jgi:type I restriction enzyme M protein|nr:N-6 DNA methylase [Puniceicoccales bacterium]